MESTQDVYHIEISKAAIVGNISHTWDQGRHGLESHHLLAYYLVIHMGVAGKNVAIVKLRSLQMLLSI